jgi:hypothetical protein
MSINYESTAIGEVRATHLSAVPGIAGSVLCFTLSWTLHPKREHAYSVFGTYIVVSVTKEGSRDSRILGHAVPETAWCEESREGIPFDRPLMYRLPVQADQMLALEHLRQGNGLLFTLEIRGNVSGPYGIRQTYESAQFRISVSDWIQALHESQASDVLLVGVNLPLASESSTTKAAIELVRRSHESLLRGEYDSAVGQCRRALESLWNGQKLTDSARNARKALSSSMDDRKSMSKLERQLALGEAVINFTHPAHHVGNDGDPEIFSRLDAALAVASTASLVSSFAEKFQ